MTLLRPYLLAHGESALAYSTLVNPEFKHVFVPGLGSLAYFEVHKYKRRIIMSISDPLAPREAWCRMTERFLEVEPEVWFAHTSAEYARVLADMGMCVNDLGIETQVRAVFLCCVFLCVFSRRREEGGRVVV
jgi:hypothetical protein